MILEENKEWKRIGEPTAQACKISKHSSRNQIVQGQEYGNHYTTNEDSWPAANYFGQTNSEGNLTREYCVSRFGITQVCFGTGNDAAAETGSNEAERSSAQSSTHIRDKKEVMCRRAKECTKRTDISYWRSSRISFQNNSRRADLQNGRLNSKSNSRKGLFRQTSHLIALVPRSMRSCRLRLMIYSLRDISALRKVHTEPQFYLYQRRMGAGACVWIIAQ